MVKLAFNSKHLCASQSSCHLGNWPSVLLSPETDYSVSRCQKHCLGVIWWQEETGDPAWRLVKSIHCHYLLALPSFRFLFPQFRIHLRFVSLPTASRSLHLATQCHPSVAMTWYTTGSKAWLSVCTGMYARGRRDWQTSQTHQTPKTESAGAFYRS